MPSSYSPNLRFELQATGENRSTWGVKGNNDFSLVEQAIAGISSIAMTDANQTLTATNGTVDQSRSAILSFTGTLTANRIINVPTVSKLYCIRNNTAGGFTLTIMTTGVGSVGCVIPNNTIYMAYCDALSCFLVQPILNAGAVGLGNVDNTSDVNKPVSTAQAAAIAAAVPAGVISPIATKTAPTGWLAATGQLVSRTTYATLWTAAQASGMIASSDSVWTSSTLYGQYSPGDGSTTFRVPWLAGYHIRGWVASGGIDSGRTAGALQASTVLSHSHGYSDPTHNHSINQSAHAHGVNDPTHAHTIFGGSGGFSGDGYCSTNVGNNRNTSTAAAGTGISIQAAGISISNNASGIGITISAAGSSEGVPTNLAFPFYIKY